MNPRTRNFVITVAVIVIMIACAIGGVIIVNKAIQQGMVFIAPNVTIFGPQTAQPEAAPEQPAEPAPKTSEILQDQPPEYYFPMGKLIACTSVNGPWLEAFGKEEAYEIDPNDTSVFKSNTFYMAEGVVVNSFPVDLHQNFELTEKVTMTQGNFWDCGPDPVSDVDKFINLFNNNNGKYANWESQNDPKVFHPMLVTTPFGLYLYEKGVRPPWVAGLVDQSLNAIGVFTCIYDATNLHEQDPAGQIVGDHFVGTPGSAGCDFVVLKTGSSEAIRYNGVIERFTYKMGTIFFVFNPDLTNNQVQDMLGDLGYDVTVK